MDSLITAAARALAAGDPLGALNRVALRDDAPALALRGIAMAQLGDFDRARALIKSAARGFGAKEALARARCVVAQAEIALGSRDLAWPTRALDHARATLDAHGDRVNAAHAHALEVRWLAFVGRLDDAERRFATLDTAALPPASQALQALIEAGIAMRRLRTHAARDALDRAARMARRSGIGALMAEVEQAAGLLREPAARVVARGEARLLRLDDVEALFASDMLIVDATRNGVRAGDIVVALATRPVLFTLARMFGEAWPGDASRDALIAGAFRIGHADETHRARLRVEMGRLRTMLRPLADIDATARGFTLAPHRAREVAVLTRPVEDDHAPLLAFLSDGQAWSSSALALALNASQRTVQRALDALASAHKVQSIAGAGAAGSRRRCRVSPRRCCCRRR
ncbi:Malic enzyme [Candidatus Burkholderia verschuerenii]|uniref:Malic enzyme n=1 Tax=Candidatus Burkholderia verschuerenii TaxID=242163 RepID=A0A0L0MHE2_9BURK|nr:Malic enzyme [Candidatus Burkholderia verschuerenii]